MAKNVDAVLKGGKPSPVKGMPFDILVCCTGRGRTAGRIGVVKMLSFFGWQAKGKTLAVEMIPGYVDGKVA